MHKAIKLLALLGVMFIAASPISAATFTVTNINDSGAGSLRQAIIDAEAQTGADTIVFQSGVTGTIQLQSALPVLSTDLQIFGPGAGVLAVRRFAGGIYGIFNVTNSPTITISGLRITNGQKDNSTFRGGAGVYVAGGNFTIAGCVLDTNSAVYSGGAISANVSGGFTMTDCVVSDNTSTSGAGGIYLVSNSNSVIPFEITNSTVSTNIGYDTGAIDIQISNTNTPTPRLTNVTMSGNYASNGVGGFTFNTNYSSVDLRLINCTVVNNVAQLSGQCGGVKGNSSFLSSPKLLNCLIAQNTNPGGRSDILGNLTSLGYNFVGDGTGGIIAPTAGDQFGTSGAPLNPVIGALANNGGTTQTHALLYGSTCINGGTSVSAPIADQRGQVRVGATDIGAFEYAPSAPECDVSFGSTPIASGSVHNIPGIFSPSVASNVTYTFTNFSAGVLTLTNPAAIGSQTNCSVNIVTPPAASIDGMQTSSTVLAITPQATGPFSFTYSIANNDSNENPYTWTVNGTATAPQPEINMKRDGATVLDSGSDNVGTTFAPGFASQLTYTIENLGTALLTLSNPATVTPVSNCSVGITTAPASSVGSGSSTTTVITVIPSALGNFSFTYSINSNDSNESPYNFTVNGVSAPAAPEMETRRSGTLVQDGSSDALPGTFTTGSPFALTYTFNNIGTGNLSISNPATISSLSNCTVSITTPPGTSVVPGNSTTTTLSVTPLSNGAFSFSYSIANNDSDENPYNFLVGGTALLVVAPEIDVQRPVSTSISSGGIDNLGSLNIATPSNFTYTIQNFGNGTLNLSGTPLVSITGQSNCSASVTVQPPASIGASSSATFTVQVNVTGSGAFAFNLSIANDDSNENPYAITVLGSGVAPQPEIDVRNPAAASIPVGGNDTLGNVTVGTPVNRTFTIHNFGGANLTLSGAPLVAITSQGNCTANVTVQPAISVIAPSSSTTFTVQFTVTGLSAFNFSLSITNDDSNENPYTFTVSGTGVAAPAPEIDIQRPAGTSIGSGGPDTLTGAVVSVVSPITYTIENTGNAALSLIGATPVTITAQLNCTVNVTSQPPASIAASGQATFTLDVTALGTGGFSFTILVASNDATENPYTINVSGNASPAPAPEIDVQRPAGTSIADGGPDTAPAAVAGTPLVLTYTIANLGNATLTLTGGSPVTLANNVNCNASITSQPSGSVSGGLTTTFTLSVTPLSPGTFSVDIQIASNDADEAVYDIAFGGSASAPPPAEIDVQRPAGTSIASGGPDALGTLALGTPTPVIYTVENQGGSALTLGAVTLSGQTNCSATVSANPASPVGGGTTTTFTITVTVSSSAAFSFTVSMVNSDSNENPYVINVSGTGGAGSPEIDVQRPVGTSIPSGGTDNQGNVPTTLAHQLVFTVANIGTDNLSVTAATILTQTNCAASITASPVGTVPPLTGTAGCVVTFIVTAAGPFDFTLRISNNDSNEALYNITVAGSGILAPEIDIQRGPTVPSGGADNVTGGQAGSGLVLTYTISNIGSSNLTLGPSPIVNFLAPANCTVSVTQPLTTVLSPGNSTTFNVTVTPVTAGGFSVQINVINDDADESPYSFLINGTASTGGGGGGDNGDDEGCTTSDTGGFAPFMAALLALVALHMRRRFGSARR